MGKFVETLGTALGPYWIRIGIVIASTSYVVVGLTIDAINGFSESHGFGFLIPTVPKVAYTLVLLSLLLAFCFGRYAHQLRLGSLPAMKIKEIRIEQFHPSETMTNVEISLMVENSGLMALSNCLVKLDDLSGADRKYSHHSPRAFRNRSQLEQNRSGAFNLRGGETKEVPIIYYKVTRGDTFNDLKIEFEDGSSMSFDPTERNIMSIGLYSEIAPRHEKLKIDRLNDGWISVTKIDEKALVS